MALKLDLKSSDVGLGLGDLVDCHLFISDVSFDWRAKTLNVIAQIFRSRAAFESGASALPVAWPGRLSIGKDPQDARTEFLRDERGNVIFQKQDGKIVALAYEIPATPSFDEVVQLLTDTVVAGQNFKTVGYELLKKLPFVADRNPRDDYK